MVLTLVPQTDPPLVVAARECLGDAIKAVGEVEAVVIVVLGRDGRFALRSAWSDGREPFDVYARSGGVIDREKARFME